MRKLIVTTMITIDGVMQAPGASKEDTSEGFKYGGWATPYMDDFTEKAFKKDMSGRFDLLLGRKTYEIFRGYWPEHADGWPRINEVKKYVVSNDSSLKLDWENSELITGDIVEKVKKLKERDGSDLEVWGSSYLVQTFLKHDLVDELWLKIFPITLGTGKRLFAEGTIPAAFELIKSGVSPKGVIFADYKRAGDVRTASMA